ncbi:MAG: hypothetical protein JWM76_2475, partial [Pseudonocardiales bacterium]|nr:hypothetical protein [Pseudonocardiales bacterium]
DSPPRPADEVLEFARQFGLVAAGDVVPVDVVPVDVVPVDVVGFDRAPTELPAETRRYLAAVLFDLATADPGAGTETISSTLAFARRWAVGPEFERMIKTELDLSDRAAARVIAGADERSPESKTIR